MLRKLGVVGKFVEFYGPGIAELPLADRATISNMAPEYGATCGIFPVDAETLRYLRLTGRTEEQIALVEDYYKAQGLFHTADAPEAEYYSATLSLDLATVEPSVAGPKRPQDRVAARRSRGELPKQLPSLLGPNAKRNRPSARSRAGSGEGGHSSRRLRRIEHRRTEPGSSTGSRPGTTSVKERFGIDLDQYLDHGSSSSPPSPAAPTPSILPS